MARKKRSNGDQPIGVGLTTKQMKRKKPLNTHYLTEVQPLSDHQTELFDSYSAGKHIIAYGVAGTGKTFITRPVFPLSLPEMTLTISPL